MEYKFQSTHPRRVRLGLEEEVRKINVISIHAPARGATLDKSKMLRTINISIHAPARGATPKVWVNANADNNFNPRTREGCDLIISASFESV